MTNEQMERAIEFLLQHHSKVSADIERHSEQIAKNSEQIEQLTRGVAALKVELRVGFGEVWAGFAETRQALDSLTEEMRSGFNNLILAIEATHKLAEDVARLAVATSQRVTNLESNQ